MWSRARGYDLHQDCDVEITDTYFWKPQDKVKRCRLRRPAT